MLVYRANVRAVGTLAGADTQARQKTSEEKEAFHKQFRLLKRKWDGYGTIRIYIYDRTCIPFYAGKCVLFGQFDTPYHDRAWHRHRRKWH